MAEQLSCDACRRSKTRCSKEKPTCTKCHQKGYECVYHPRAQRTRRKNPLKSVLERLQHLEEHGAVRRPPRELIPKTELPPPQVYLSPPKQSDRSPGVSVYITPESLASQGIWAKESPVSSRDVAGSRDALSLDLDRETAQKWVDNALSKNMFVRFMGLVDVNIIKAMPGIIDNGYVRFDPSVLLIYYIMLIQGSFDDFEPRVCYWRHRIYQQCLAIAPDWTREPKVTDMDLTAAYLVFWTAHGCFDNLSHWNLFCQACHIANELGIPDLESHIDPNEDPVKDDTRRILFWQLLRMECYFRVYQDKPPVLTAKPFNVSLPTFSIQGVSSPMDATLATICMLHAHLTLAIIDCWKVLDDDHKSQGEARATIEEKIEHLEESVKKFELEETLDKVPGVKHKMYYADPLIMTFGLMIQLTRKLGVHARPDHHTRSREYARKILTIMVRLGEIESPDPEFKSITLSIVSANPFVAFFFLRDAAIADADRETANRDFELLGVFAGMLVDSATAQGFHTLIPYARHLLETSRGEGLHICPLT